MPASMPFLPRNHRVGHEGVIFVQGILSDAGAVSEVITNDYGEDILVQTQIKDVADNFSILIQVKSSSKIKMRAGSFRKSFSAEHVRRWVSHLQPVLLCIYDQQEKKAYGLNPKEHYSLWQIATTDKENLPFKIGKDDIFDKYSASQFIWKCRIEYYYKLLSNIEYLLIGVHDRLSKKFQKKALLDCNVIVFSFLICLEVITEKGELSDKFIEFLSNAVQSFENTNAASSKTPLNTSDAIALTVLGCADEMGAPGLPANLIEHSVRLLSALCETKNIEPYNEGLRKLDKQVS